MSVRASASVAVSFDLFERMATALHRNEADDRREHPNGDYCATCWGPAGVHKPHCRHVVLTDPEYIETALRLGLRLRAA